MNWSKHSPQIMNKKIKPVVYACSISMTCMSHESCNLNVYHIQCAVIEDYRISCLDLEKPALKCT